MPKHPRGNRKLIQAINRSAVLNTIKTHGPISRTDIAQHTGLSAATVSGITAGLLKSELILEKAIGNSSGGRRPILLELNPSGGYVIGLKLSEEKVTGALTDLEATVIRKHTDVLDDHSVEIAVETMNRVVQLLLAEGEVDAEQFLGIGVGLAGIIDARGGILRYSPIFGWHDVPLAEMLQSRLQVPVYIDNDVNTLTITEQWFGKGQGVDNFLTITIGRGVGMGIVVNGQIYHGGKGGAGEFGHTVMDPRGAVCGCGNRGCLETFVSDPALLRMAVDSYERGDMSNKVASMDELLARAQRDDPGAINVFARAGKVLGRAVANLINVLSPELIIISGEGVRADDLLFEPMRASISEHVMSDLSADTQIQIDVWDDDAWARGAAGLVLRGLFESPISSGQLELTA
ncbi:MAG: ROK family transcriptional regulator [Anaerolineales bacterium]|jgi:predicted NBD/HSP70 family sugar kinase